MAAATVGRGRARGISAVKTSPDPIGLTRPPAVEVSGGLVMTRPSIDAVTDQSSGSTGIPQHINILMMKAAGYEEAFCTSVKSSLETQEQIEAWLTTCVPHLYGKRITTKLFVIMIRKLCAHLVPNEDKTHALDQKLQEMLRKGLLIKLEKDFMRVSAQTNDTVINERDICGFTEILSAVYLNFPLPNGSLIHQLADPLWQCLNRLSKPGNPVEMFRTVHYVCMCAGWELERSLTSLNVVDKLEDLYNQFRSVVIDDVTEDGIRLMMMETIEMRAFGYKVPERCSSYYQSEKDLRGN